MLYHLSEIGITPELEELSKEISKKKEEEKEDKICSNDLKEKLSKEIKKNHEEYFLKNEKLKKNDKPFKLKFLN